MSKRTLLIIIGFLLLITPFWGIPEVASMFVTAIIGILIMIIGVFTPSPKHTDHANTSA